MPPVASTTAFAREDAEPPALAVVADRAGHAVAVLEQRDDGALHVHVDALVDRRGPAACGSSRDPCGRPRARGADSGGRRSCAAGSARRACGRTPRPTPPARARGPAPPCACSSAMRQLLMYCPPRIVSAKCTRQLSRSSTLPSAAAMPPSAITVCALPSSDLQTRPTVAPRGRGLDGGAQPGTTGADDQHVVFDASRTPPSEDPQVGPDAHAQRRM